eukprot:1182387-Prorocentrum_minimum.AAC.5
MPSRRLKTGPHVRMLTPVAQSTAEGRRCFKEALFATRPKLTATARAKLETPARATQRSARHSYGSPGIHRVVGKRHCGCVHSRGMFLTFCSWFRVRTSLFELDVEVQVSRQVVGRLTWRYYSTVVIR